MQLSVWMQHQQSEGSHTVMVCQYVATNTDAAFIGTILRWLFSSSTTSAWFYFILHHVFPDSTSCSSCPVWFYFFFSPSCPAWFHFLTIMSSLILFSVHHVQPDFIFVHHVQPGIIFCSSCPAWSPHIMPSQGAQTTLGTTPCQPLSSLSSQSQPKDLFPCILACTPTHKIFHEYHNTHPHPAHDGLTHTAGQINDPIQVC